MQDFLRHRGCGGGGGISYFVAFVLSYLSPDITGGGGGGAEAGILEHRASVLCARAWTNGVN